jgi:hypothetical protein
MKPIRQTLALILLVVFGLVLAACGINIARNDDGSLTVEAKMTEADLQREIRMALSDALVQDMTVDLRDDHLFVSASRYRLNSGITDSLSFRLDLGTSDGHLTATISDAQLNQMPIDPARVAVWNERTANRLARAGNRNPNSSLQTVTIGDESVTMIWRVETARSRNG